MIDKRDSLIPEDARTKLDEWRNSGKTVVFTNGCFDLIHPGHIYILRRAKALGGVLVVGLNSDSSVRRLKGAQRPLIPEHLRKMSLEELRSVDLVIVFDDDTPHRLIAYVKPDILVKGSDYAVGDVVGADIVESLGGKVVILDLLPGFSTSELMKRLSDNHQ